MSQFDITGIGQNAVDTLILTDRYAPHASKERFHGEMESPGGQVATAMVACAKLGLRTKYVGTVGDDARAQTQRASLAAAGLEAHLLERLNCPTQSAYIVIDATGERTVFWRRDAALELRPNEIDERWIANSRMLYLDAGDLPAVIRAAEIARAHQIPVALDADTIYPDLGRLFANTDYLIATRGLLESWTSEPDPARAIEKAQREYGCRAVGITLGSEGCLVLAEGELHYSPGFVVDCVDTTGAGDVFHGALCYSVLEKMRWPDALDFSNAMAALNCRALGARGSIAGRTEVIELIANGQRRASANFGSTL